MSGEKVPFFEKASRKLVKFRERSRLAW